VFLSYEARCASFERAVLKMREGPSVSPIMREEPNRLMRLSLRVMVVSDKEKKAEKDLSGMFNTDEHKRTIDDASKWIKRWYYISPSV